jgi:hypothetical protein
MNDRDGFTLSREEVEAALGKGILRATEARVGTCANECTVACGCLVRVVQAGEGFAVEPIRSCVRHAAYWDGWRRSERAGGLRRG